MGARVLKCKPFLLGLRRSESPKRQAVFVFFVFGGQYILGGPWSQAFLAETVETGYENSNDRQHKGCVFLEKSKSGFQNPKKKNDCAFLGAIPKTDHESIKFTFWVGSTDQIQIRILEIHHLSILWERIWKKYFWQAVFRTKMAHNRCRKPKCTKRT